MDELAIEFQRTANKKIIRKILALNRLLTRMSKPPLNRKDDH